MLIKSRVVLGSAVALLALSACTPKDGAKDSAKSPAAATVNGVAISQKQVETILKQQAAQGMPDNAESRKMIIDNLSLQIILAQDATKKGLEKTAEVSEQLEMIKQSVLAQAFVQDYIKTNPVTDAMLAAEYEKIKAQATGNQLRFDIPGDSSSITAGNAAVSAPDDPALTNVRVDLVFRILPGPGNYRLPPPIGTAVGAPPCHQIHH